MSTIGNAMEVIGLQYFSRFSQLKNKIKISPLARRLVHGTLWNLVGTILARGLSVVASIAVARMLGKVGFGELGIIQSTLLNLSVFTSHGLGLTAIKYVSELRYKDPARAGRILTLSGVVASVGGGLIALALALSSSWFAQRILAAPHLAGLLRIGALLVFFSAMNGAQNGALAGFEAFRKIAQVNLIAGLLNFPLMIGGAWFAGVEGAVYGLVVSSAAGWLITHRALRIEARRANVHFVFQGIWTEFSVLRSYSLPALLSSVLYGPVGLACSVMLVNQPDGYPQMAVFNATNQWFAMVMFLPALVSQVVLPMFSESVSKDDTAGTNKILSLAARTNAAIVIPLVFVASLASPWILSLYGKGYADYWATFVVSLVTAGVLALVSPWAEVLNAGKVQWPMFVLNLAWGMISLVGMSFLVGWGVLGLVLSRFLAFAVKAVLTVLCANVLLKRMTGAAPSDSRCITART
jgi:O-antigen/teichoic acid export membrane protein